MKTALSFLPFLLIILPLIGWRMAGICNKFKFSAHMIRGTIILVWITFFLALDMGIYVWRSGQAISFDPLLYFNPVSAILILMVTFISAIVHSFSVRYMDGATDFHLFFGRLSLLTSFVIAMICADHMILFIAAWLAMGTTLCLLMGHASQWEEARHAAIIALSNIIIGTAALAVGLSMISHETGVVKISEAAQLIANDPSQYELIWPAILILVAAMIQSALWPASRWLLSSLNAPTSVSAFMHAGIINAGGVLIIRFAPVFNAHTEIMTLVFAVGALSALLGSAWMLVQSDIKRSLACSTMAQMGFMIMQCGLGFYTAALTHIVMHSFFKASLFLSSASAVRNGAPAPDELFSEGLTPLQRVFRAIFVLVSAMVAAEIFAVLSGKDLALNDTGAVLIAFAMLAGLQAGFSWSRTRTTNVLRRVLVFSVSVMLFAALYAGGFKLVDSLAASPVLTNVQGLNFLHYITLLLFFAGWVLFGIEDPAKPIRSLQSWLYVRFLNGGQPFTSTIALPAASHYKESVADPRYRF